ncbi:MAG TPA: hypothetical protein VM364_14280 [Vicinamibacterales bacterium]|nr:hypothetical protein [Vicinamibacterales bacterium]
MSARLKLALTAAGGLVPRMVFGNYAGVGNNVKATRELARLRRAFAASPAGMPATDVASGARFLSEKGYLLLQSPYDPELMRRIQRQYRAVVEDPAHSVAPATAMPTYRHVKDPIHCIPELHELINEQISAILVSHYGCYFKVGHVRAWRTYHVPGVGAGEDVYSNTWHTDQCPVTSLRLFVYLSDEVTRNSGAFQFQSKPETAEIVRSPGYLSRSIIVGKAKALVQDPTRIKYFEGGLGSACFCNVQVCLHRAGVPGPGTMRDVAQFYLAPSDRPLEPDWHRKLPVDRGVMM